MEYDVDVAASARIVQGVLTEAHAFVTHTTSASSALNSAANSLPNSRNVAAAITSFNSVTVGPTITAVHDYVKLSASGATFALLAYQEGDGEMAATAWGAGSKAHVADMPGAGRGGAR